MHARGHFRVYEPHGKALRHGELKTYDQIVHFTISSDMSACFQNACDAAEEFPGRVFVVDSRNLSTGIGHLVIDGALLAREGKSGEEIKAILDERREKLNVSFVIDTLEYLRKGGRCSTVAALGANLLKLKPCIEVHEGKMSVAKKYRGTLAKAIESYVTDRIKDHDDFDKKRVFITDSGVDMEIVETHHNRKADAPSGTAKLILRQIDPEGLYTPVYGRSGRIGARGREIGVHAVRGGTAAGEHSLRFFGRMEELELRHRADSREIFAQGALRAAAFAQKAEPGLYDMEDVLFGGDGWTRS